MEHIIDVKSIVEDLLLKCNELYIFVPYKENPLYEEHVNYYTEIYYDDFNVLEKYIFIVNSKTMLPFRNIIKNFFLFRFTFNYNFTKEIIMFHLKGKVKD